MIIKKQRNVIRIHERLIATKHRYNAFLPFFLCAAILFFAILIAREVILSFERAGTYYTSDKGTVIVFTIAFLLICYTAIILLFRKNKSSPYKRIIYDTKFKWFRVYYKGYYHIIRPSDIIRIKPKKIFKYSEDEQTKFYGCLVITTVDYSKASNVYKTITVFCTNPKEAKVLMDECIKEKLFDDFKKVERSRKVAKIQSTRIKYQEPYQKSKEQIKKEMAEIKKKEEPQEEETSFNAWD